MTTYELKPTNRKSFYGKALVINDKLYSYGTLIMSRTDDGNFVRHWDGWSATTGRHIAAFSGLNKKQFMNLPLEEKL